MSSHLHSVCRDEKNLLCTRLYINKSHKEYWAVSHTPELKNVGSDLGGEDMVAYYRVTKNEKNKIKENKMLVK